MGKSIRYWFRFREQDGSWSYWMECSQGIYEDKLGDDFYDTTTTTGTVP